VNDRSTARIAQGIKWLRLWSKLPLSVRNLRNRFESTDADRRDANQTTTASLGEIQSSLASLERRVAELTASSERRDRVLDAILDDSRRDRDALRELRASEAYRSMWDSEEPLVSVTVATFDRPGLLFERAVSSVRSQSYSNWELVIVGDGCARETADEIVRRIDALGDARIRFENLPFHVSGPIGPTHRWMVGGTNASNRAIELARGEWVAPLDDDDEFLPDHIETLLEVARRTRAELVYGAIEQHTGNGSTVLYASPPTCGQFGFQAAMFLRGLRFFEFSWHSWVLDEPGDVNLLRRMLTSGVLFGTTDRVVTRYYPSTSRTS